MREVEYGGPTVGFRGAGGKDRGGGQAAGAGDEMGRVGGGKARGRLRTQPLNEISTVDVSRQSGGGQVSCVP